MWKEQDAGTYADDNVFHCIPAQYFYDKKIVMVTSGDHQGLVTSGDADTLQISRGLPTGAWQLQATQALQFHGLADGVQKLYFPPF